jgi:F420H(2)-dependent quinone reductase
MFKFFIAVANFVYRISGGRIGGRMNGGDVLLLTTTGRKTGKQRTHPLVYLSKESAYIVIASAAGAPKHPAWFFNVRSNPQAVIQVKDKLINVTAEVADKEKRGELWAWVVSALPSFEQYQQNTKREIPVVILHPSHPADEKVTAQP